MDATWQILLNDSDFVDLNKRGHNMYSAGFNRYHEFASGEFFGEKKELVPNLDVPMSKSSHTQVDRSIWKRSGILRIQAIEYAGYQCEMDHEHKTFIAEKTHKPYMEAHHFLPLGLQEQMPVSLDVYANIICLCPICHRKIHLGLKKERIEMIDEMYEKRNERLVHAGIELGKQEFEDMVLGAR